MFEQFLQQKYGVGETNGMMVHISLRIIQNYQHIFRYFYKVSENAQKIHLMAS